MTTAPSAGLLRRAAKFALLLLLCSLSCRLAASARPGPEAWVPIRWTGGPLELAWRTHTKTLPADSVVADAIARWYEPATLSLFDDSPANCLLVTWSAPAEAAVQSAQQQLVKTYAEAAHKRGLAVLGLVYAAGDPWKIAADALQAGLDGLVLEGDFAADFVAALGKAAAPMVVIEIAKDASSWRWKRMPMVAVEGVPPSGRNLSEMGIRGAPSSEPWIESNIWLVRSFAAAFPPPLVWISSQLRCASTVNCARAVADAAAAQGHWVISLDDAFRAKLRARDAAALESWQCLSKYLKFSESLATSRALAPYGRVGIILDPANTSADEYLKLVARRQVPYRLIERSHLEAAAVANFRALVATDVDPISAAERKILQDFAANGGMVMAGPSWGDAPESEPFAEIPTGRGRVIVYKDPDPETLARDLKEMLSDDDLGVIPFNVPSVITSTSGGGAGEPLVVQLVNYFDHPVEAITLRLVGKFGSARLERPEGPPVNLPLRVAEGRTEVTIPTLLVWGAVSMQ